MVPLMEELNHEYEDFLDIGVPGCLETLISE